MGYCTCGDLIDPDSFDDYCAECAAERAGDMGPAIDAVFDENLAGAERRMRFHDSMPEGQRSGKGHTNGG